MPSLKFARTRSAPAFRLIFAALAIGAAASPALAAPPPPAFAQCQVCHSTERGKNMIGPSLAGIVGRKAAIEPGFAYSPALKAKKLTWDKATLDKWLTNPMAMVPGTRMTYAGLANPAQRQGLIAYLATLK